VDRGDIGAFDSAALFPVKTQASCRRFGAPGRFSKAEILDATLFVAGKLGDEELDREVENGPLVRRRRPGKPLKNEVPTPAFI
jgi:hypothetical protein